MTGYTVKPLDSFTWHDFARLAERHNGVWGGCWCMGFHAKGPGWGVSAAMNRSEKEQLVAERRAHAALVFAGRECVGWCQFGPTAELPRIKSLKAYEAGLSVLPDWRITCFFVSRRHRGKGVAAAALDGAIAEIARHGGGTVESYPDDVEDAKLARGFGHNATVAMFERRGFVRQRRIAKNRWVVVRRVEAA
ncbi:MAG TPA: GNAT family N-acetyltransferase [Caulobacteraceae bacterium]|nr:GNAT family N-acetyltransferase [Caulobacteraceae bacterium]